QSGSPGPGPPPRTSAPATAPPAHGTTGHPVSAAASVQWPTRRPATAVNVWFAGSPAVGSRSGTVQPSAFPRTPARPPAPATAGEANAAPLAHPSRTLQRSGAAVLRAPLPTAPPGPAAAPTT